MFPPIKLNVQAEYNLNSAVNQSTLKELLIRGPQGLKSYLSELLAQSDKEAYYEEKGHFVIGKGVDMLLTGTPEAFKEQHHISTIQKKPSDTMLKVCHLVADRFPAVVAGLKSADEFEPSRKRVIHEALNEIGYYMNRAKANPLEDKRVTEFIEDAIITEYMEDIFRGLGKQIISQVEYEIIIAIRDSLFRHPRTAHLFRPRPGIITIYQYPVFFMVEGMMCKGLLDRIDIDLNALTIEPMDIKTMSGYTDTFPRSMQSRRYDIQGSYYTEGLTQTLSDLESLIEKETGLHLDFEDMGFTIKPFKFIVESTTQPGTPMVFVMSDALLQLGKDGDDRYKGFVDLVRKYKFWNECEFDLDIAMNRLALSEVTVHLKFESNLP